jgi:hypothetical protein
MAFQMDDSVLEMVRDNPHLLGNLAGKERLTEQHSDWIKYVWDTAQHRTFEGHRGSYKTTGIVVVGTIRWLLFHPSDRIAIIRKTFTDAADCLRVIRQIMEMPEIMLIFHYAHNGLWPKAITKKDNSLIYNFKRTQTPEGNVDAYGIHTGITGKHYDKIIADDIVTIEDRISRAEREKVKIRTQEIMTNIIDPGKSFALTGTPWHKDDAWGMKDDGGVQILPEPMKVDVYHSGILTEAEIEQKRKTITRSMFSANYELKHIADESRLFKEPHWQMWDFTYTSLVHLDAAFDGDHFNALTFMAKKPDGRIQAIGFSYPGNVKDWFGRIFSYYRKYRGRRLWNEDNPDKGFVADELKKIKVTVKSYTEHQNKHYKITTFLYKYWDLIDWDEGTDPEYINQILDYEEGGEPDDGADSAASLIREAIDKKDNSGLYEM